MNTYCEKRKAQRINVDLQTVFWGSNLDIEKTAYAQIKNISKTGGYLALRNPYDTKSHIQVRFILPIEDIELSRSEKAVDNNKEDILITCKAKIVRKNKTAGKYPATWEHGLGIEIIEISKENMETLENFINFSAKQIT